MQTVVWLWAGLCAVGAGETQAKAVEDWTEGNKTWHASSYWADPKILQKYTFTEDPEDKVVGGSSWAVHMRVAEKRPRDGIELRLVLPKPIDLSKEEAVAVHLKVLSGSGLKPRNVYFCSPGYQKLAVCNWSKLDMTPGGKWQRAVFDLAEASIIDKAAQKQGTRGSYDRREVKYICINFTLPRGEVDHRILLDGLAVTKLPPPEVRRVAQPDGSFVVETDCYRVVIGANGYMQSLRAGQTEFLKPWAIPVPKGQAGADPQTTGSGCFVDNRPDRGLEPLGKPEAVGRKNVTATGDKVSLKYVFRKEDFDIVLKQTIVPHGGLYHLILSPDVVVGRDGRTDRGLEADKLEAGRQIHTRLLTTSGGVLACRQSQDGYSRMGVGLLPGKAWSLQLMAWHVSPHRFNLRPVGKPSAGDAVCFDVDCANPDFLLPGGEPVRFDITATNYAGEALTGEIAFQVCDYLTRKPVAERRTPFTLNAKQTMPVPTDVAIDKPGPYRGRVVVSDASGRSRQIEWVFTYDFQNYKPATTRAPDFKAFWKKQLDDLAKVPLDVKMTPMPKVSTKTCECFRVSMGALDGRRVHAWYWRPRKPGKYPVSFVVPPSGVHSRGPNRAPHNSGMCGLWIQIQGLECDFDRTKLPKDLPEFRYWTHGLEKPETSMWRIVYTNMVRGVDFLCSRPEVDAKRIMVGGGSQGGGLSMVLAGLDQRIAFSAPCHSGLPRLDWTVLHRPGFWPFGIGAKPAGHTTEQFLKTISYFDAANFTPDIACPIVAEVSLLDTVTASGNQICALAHVKPGLLELICDPWTSHASMPRGSRLRGAAIGRFMAGQPPVKNPAKRP